LEGSLRRHLSFSSMAGFQAPRSGWFWALNDNKESRKTGKVKIQYFQERHSRPILCFVANDRNVATSMLSIRCDVDRHRLPREQGVGKQYWTY
jgi:hypothetical protein